MKKQLLASLPALIGAGLIVVLSFQLVKTKRANAGLLGDLTRSTQHFVQGADVPNLKLNSGVEELELRSFCSSGNPLLVYLSSPSCPYCANINPEVESLARRRRDLTVVNIVLGPGAQPKVEQSSSMRVVSAAPGEVAEAFRVNVVPAVIAADGACRIQAAGAGFNASRAVIQHNSEPKA